MRRKVLEQKAHIAKHGTKQEYIQGGANVFDQIQIFYSVRQKQRRAQYV